MELHSLKFVALFAVVFAIYYLFSKRKTAQNIILLVASYAFYAYASVKIVPIILLMTLFFYYMGMQIDKNNELGDEDKASRLTIWSIVIGLLPLFYFKYFNFFYDSFVDLFNLFGLHFAHSVLKILLPLGLSFYTFRLISYVIEIDQCSIHAERNIINFATYVAYFPSLIAGPIDRPNDFLPQLQQNRTAQYENLVEGLKRFIWGWFMKICVADRMSAYMDPLYADFASQNGATMFLVILMMPFRTYCDFAGYSHMAIGVSRMLGITSAENFNRPFFAQNIADYWRRWHMSLTQWVTDYVYTPLNFKFRRKGKWGMFLAIFFNFLIIGFWHKASWTYVAFGIYNALLFIPVILSDKYSKETDLNFKRGWCLSFKNIWKLVLTYIMVAIGCALATGKTLGMSVDAMAACFNTWGIPCLHNLNNIVVFIIGIIIICVKDYLDECGAKYNIFKSNKAWIVALTLIIFIVIIFAFRGNVPKEFIYKQF